MVVGPYLSLLPSAQQILEMAERYELPPVRTHLLEKFYPTLPQITDSSVFYSMVYCLCEALYGRKAEVRSISLEDKLSPTALSVTAREADLSTAMQRLENRYQLEGPAAAGRGRRGPYPAAPGPAWGRPGCGHRAPAVRPGAQHQELLHRPEHPAAQGLPAGRRTPHLSG